MEEGWCLRGIVTQSWGLGSHPLAQSIFPVCYNPLVANMILSSSEEPNLPCSHIRHFSEKIKSDVIFRFGLRLIFQSLSLICIISTDYVPKKAAEVTGTSG